MPIDQPNPAAAARGSVHVVGAGILGLSAAWHLHLAGYREITVVDAGPALHGTTPAGAGFVLPAAADESRRGGTFAVPISHYSLDFYRRLHSDGHDIEFGEHGNIVMATTESFLAESAAGIAGHPLADPGTRVLSAADVVSLTGGAVDGAAITGGVFMPRAGQVTTSRVVEVLTALLEAEGVQIVYGARVTALQTADGRVSLLSTSVGDLPVEAVVLAGGAWLNALLEPLGTRLPLLPMVATRFVTADAGLAADMPTIQSRDLGPMWLRNLHGSFSWGAGPGYRSSRLLRASGVDTGVAVGRPRADVLVDALRVHQPVMEHVFPVLADVEVVTVIQGQPVWTADGRGYVGEVPGVDGLWALGGDNESGVMNGPGMGRLLADIVTGADDPIADVAAFRLDRLPQADFPTEESIEAFIASEGDRVAHAFTD
ncbi:glycine/D-amino acid oxidase-like deaminating enzyme [Frondihabitans sp. PhB188]|uniref:NAD(P)/FAD-dependent oxidoreductase n=1 Tax=Frondihabitans sp. PhB188 TaxID=2485200 RepID=UPI000F49EC9F|nr:FAD-binding oxidoreductase [Frondihabitans sp. PhB188]ROQ39862.1 glycine/D-amino acid oxidase-like deaminating enzyme [Frondihabitans sp. PhB188]